MTGTSRTRILAALAVLGLVFALVMPVMPASAITPSPTPAPSPTPDGAVDFTGLDVTSYGLSPHPQDLSGGASVVDGGVTLVLSGNTWKKVPLETVIASDTVLEFDAFVAAEGEIQGLGFDNDNSYAQLATFQFAGTTSPWGIPVELFGEDVVGSPGWVHYEIPIGTFYQGSFTHLFFVNDDDATAAAEVAFANIVVTTPVPPPPVELTPAPSPTPDGAVDFTGLDVTSYGDSPALQDLTGGASVVDGGVTLVLSGNTWKKVPLETVIASDTVLEFDAFVAAEGEIQGLGFDNDNSYAQLATFQFAGTTSPWGIPVELFGEDVVGSPGWVHYEIPIGTFYQGSFTHLFFVNDDDATAAAEVAFANIVVTTPVPPPPVELTPAPSPTPDGAVDFTGLDVTSYGDSPALQDLTGGASVVDGGVTLVLSGNTWKKVPLETVIASDTVLEFDAFVAAEGEIQGLGFDNDNSYAQLATFQFAGTTSPWGIPVELFGEDVVGSPGWVHYEIPIGTFYQGSFTHLFFVNDDDATAAAEVAFANIVVTTPVPPPPVELTPAPSPTPDGAVDFTGLDVTSYGDSPALQDLTGGASVVDGGVTLVLSGNTWKKVPLETVIASDTVLEFDAFVAAEGEIQGLGFDNDNSYAQLATFQFAGTTSPWGIPVELFGEDVVGSPGWVHYEIPIGTFYQGSFTHLFFVNDDDATAAAEVAFANIVVTTPVPPPAPPYDPPAPALADGAVDFTGLEVTSYGVKPHMQDVSGGATVADAGRTMVLSGNTWKKVPLETEITADTVLEFDAYVAAEGEIHGLGFDNRQLVLRSWRHSSSPARTRHGVSRSSCSVRMSWVHPGGCITRSRSGRSTRVRSRTCSSSTMMMQRLLPRWHSPTSSSRRRTRAEHVG